MKQLRHFCLLSLLFSVVSVNVMAGYSYSEIDGISYLLDQDTDEALVTSHRTDKYYSGNVVIPSSVVDDEGKTYRVTGIGFKAFRDNFGLTSVTIPSSVTSIGGEAFMHCDGLARVTFGEGVESIGDLAFMYCSSLTSVTLPSSLTSIGYGAFILCSSLASVTIPSSVERIGDNAFNGCRSLTSVIVPSSVTSIGSCVFFGCADLTDVTIPSGVTSIGEGAFANCFSLASVTIPSSVASICDGAFQACSSLTSVTIPEGLMSIGTEAFENCYGLTSITIPSSVTSIGYMAFYGCDALASVALPDNTALGAYSFPEETNLYVTRGSKTLLYIWRGNYLNVYDKSSMSNSVQMDTGQGGNRRAADDAAGVPLPKPYLGVVSCNPPEATVMVCNYYDEYTYSVDGEPFAGDVVKVSGISAAENMVTVRISKDDAYCDISTTFNATGIEETTAGAAEDTLTPATHYNLRGQRIDTPECGINIIRYSDGTTRKVVVK